MRVLGATAVVSLAAHAAALVWVVDPPQPIGDSARRIDDRAAPPEPLAVVLLTSDPVVAAPNTHDRAAGVAHSTRVLATGRRVAEPESSANASPDPEAPRAEAPASAPPKRMLAMRSGPEISRTAELLDAVLDHPDNRPVTDYPGLRARVALDIARARHDLEAIVAAEDAIKAEELEPQKDGSWQVDRRGYSARVEHDGTVHLRDKPTYDLTDWMMRKAGIDPYATDKLRMLDRTRDQRVEVAKEYRREQLGRSAQLMLANLERLWATTRDVAARKQGVFDLWDECEESGEPDVVEGAAQARAQLLRFVQVKLTGASAFTSEELVRLNARRRSQARFDPYE